jgi:HrpA-like RNA helicase
LSLLNFPATQVPQFLLDFDPTASIVVTQPRRISAISIAERVAEEQCIGPVGNMIGYQVRLESASSQDTQLLFLTPGILLRKLQSSPNLEEFTHIVIDEIHEKDKYTEFLLIVLRDLLPRRPDLRVILMSATLQTEVLVDYFSEKSGKDNALRPALVEMEGRTFPVEEFFLEHVLEITGAGSAMYDDGGASAADDLEAEMARMFGVDDSLECEKCGKIGFIDTEGLGIHVAKCDGVNTSSTNEVLANDSEYDANGTESKWDGKSPFLAELQNIGGPTETQDKLLDQYQGMHDDEQIDMYLILEILQYIIKSSYGDGAILVFLPGWQEISECALMLESTAPFHDSNYMVLPLHSGIPSKDQRKVLQKPPRGVRKIILSTNIVSKPTRSIFFTAGSP